MNVAKASRWFQGMLAVLLLGRTAVAGFTFAVEPYVVDVKSNAPQEFTIAYGWKVHFTPRADHKIFAHFTDAQGRILFQDDFAPEPAMSRWPKSVKDQHVNLAPRTLRIPANLTGPFEIRMGTHAPDNPHPDAILGPTDQRLRVRVGTIRVQYGRVVFER